ncbi:hypothetical protein ABH999_000632 [Bradyrhizobium yuanmingense]|uniref:hypothetical protein n=1 Tax=Bradyrhizobium yuanmingense TaxID=108015 RepID=UPI0035159CD0
MGFKRKSSYALTIQNRTPNINGNQQLREPQREAYRHLADFAQEITDEREVGIVLPGGRGKSGTISDAASGWSHQKDAVGELVENRSSS